MKKYFKLKNILIVLLVLIALGGIGTSIYLGIKVKNGNATSEDTAKETERLVKEIGEVMVLPEEETPTLATVQDKSKLQDQDFFKNAENGDKVLVYMTAKKAILYRPSTKKIIEVSPVNMDGVTTTTTTVPSE